MAFFSPLDCLRLYSLPSQGKIQIMQKELRIFTDEEITSLVELGEVLRDIHARVISEGFVIKNGNITKPKSAG